jgi:ATP-binding cassette subfamily C (CFTR/MRP) protein 1
LQIVNVIEVSQSLLRTRASLGAALLALAAGLGLCILSYFEHTKNIRPSSIINIYLLITLPFDAAQLRTRWLRGENIVGNGVSTVILSVKILVLITEAIGKRSLLLESYAEPSPEATSGIYSRGLFWWLNPLFRLGFRGAVNGDDLFSTDKDLLSQSLQVRFNKYWANRESPPLYPRNNSKDTDITSRCNISEDPHSSLGHVPDDAVASVDHSNSTVSVDILSVYATTTYQQHHRACERV